MQTTTSPDSIKNLGPAVASYGSRRRLWREAWIWPLPGFIMACLLIVSGLDWYYYGYTQYGPTAAQAWSQNWLFWGIFVGVITLFFSVWQILRSRVRVNLFRYGVDIHNPFHSSQSLRWEEITGITSATIQDSLWSHTLRTRHKLMIFTIQGNSISLDDRIDNLLELTTRIKANLYPRLLPGLRVRFQTGKQLTFGPVSIQSNVIHLRGKQIPWGNVNHITVSAGHLVIETHNQDAKHQKYIRIPVIQIPNLELLLQILRQDFSHQL